MWLAADGEDDRRRSRVRVIWLLWYICGVCLLLALMASAITYHPAIRYQGALFTSLFCGVALVAGVMAIGLGRLPPTHRIHRSKSLWVGLVALAVSVTLLLVLVG
jgi:hypothetical protein